MSCPSAQNVDWAVIQWIEGQAVFLGNWSKHYIFYLSTILVLCKNHMLQIWLILHLWAAFLHLLVRPAPPLNYQHWTTCCLSSQGFPLNPIARFVPKQQNNLICETMGLQRFDWGNWSGHWLLEVVVSLFCFLLPFSNCNSYEPPNKSKCPQWRQTGAQLVMVNPSWSNIIHISFEHISISAYVWSRHSHHSYHRFLSVSSFAITCIINDVNGDLFIAISHPKQNPQIYQVTYGYLKSLFEFSTKEANQLDGSGIGCVSKCWQPYHFVMTYYIHGQVKSDQKWFHGPGVPWCSSSTSKRVWTCLTSAVGSTWSKPSRFRDKYFMNFRYIRLLCFRQCLTNFHIFVLNVARNIGS